MRNSKRLKTILSSIISLPFLLLRLIYLNDGFDQICHDYGHDYDHDYGGEL